MGRRDDFVCSSLHQQYIEFTNDLRIQIHLQQSQRHRQLVTGEKRRQRFGVRPSGDSRQQKNQPIWLQINGDLEIPLPSLMKMVVTTIVQGEFEKMVEKYIDNLTQKFGGEVQSQRSFDWG